MWGCRNCTRISHFYPSIPILCGNWLCNFLSWWTQQLKKLNKRVQKKISLGTGEREHKTCLADIIKVHLEPRSHAKNYTRKRKKNKMFLGAGTWSESSKVFGFISRPEKKGEISRSRRRERFEMCAFCLSLHNIEGLACMWWCYWLLIHLMILSLRNCRDVIRQSSLVLLLRKYNG